MNLKGLETRTLVRFSGQFSSDELELNKKRITGSGLERVSAFLDRVREKAGLDLRGRVVSENNFPTGAGIASSASGFAALSLAASTAAGLSLSEKELSCLARSGSGSASRSIPGGFVEWHAGSNDQNSFAETILPENGWNLVDLIAVVSKEHKQTGSSAGHHLADTSPIQQARVDDAERRLDICRSAVLNRDFEAFAEIVELDCSLMHSVMMTSDPPLWYWIPETVALIQSVLDWRKAGIPVCYTIDAGPNVHLLCLKETASEVKNRLEGYPGINTVLESSPGGPAYLLEPESTGV
jgi:diphosphomevalonate decarboxylase